MAKQKGNKQKEALGAGIRALLNDINDGEKKTAKNPLALAGVKKKVASIIEIPLKEIEINPFQPRATFNEDSLLELSDSIKIHGVLQPITVKKVSDNRYQLIAGERRLRASKLAKLEAIPAYIRQADDQEMLEIALIENIQREDLNAIEIGISYQRLLDECDLTHEEVGERLGKKRSTVTNYMRLLKLPPDVQAAVKMEKITMGHARCLIAIDDPALQLSIYNEVTKKNLSVRQTEALVKSYKDPKAPKPNLEKKQQASLPFAFQKIQDQIESKLSTKVDLNRKRNGNGTLTISFYSDDDLERLIDIIME